MQAIEQDVQFLMWNKDGNVIAGEVGADLEGVLTKRPFKEPVQYNHITQLGVGLLNWGAHVKAITIKILQHYNDASMGEWKQVLDAWLGRTPDDRGAIFADYRIKDLITSNSGRVSHLPQIFKNAIIALRSSLTLAPTHPGVMLTREEAQAEPLWNSRRFKNAIVRHRDFWRIDLETNRIVDLFDPRTLIVWTAAQIRAGWLEPRATQAGMIKTGIRQWAHIDTLVAQWSAIVRQVPEYIMRAAAAKGDRVPISACGWGIYCL